MEGGKNRCSTWRPVHLDNRCGTLWRELGDRGSDHRTENCLKLEPSGAGIHSMLPPTTQHYVFSYFLTRFPPTPVRHSPSLFPITDKKLLTQSHTVES